MSSITFNGDTSGSVQLTVPAVAGSSVITISQSTLTELQAQLAALTAQINTLAGAK
jgi:hypothetical protein